MPCVTASPSRSIRAGTASALSMPNGSTPPTMALRLALPPWRVWMKTACFNWRSNSELLKQACLSSECQLTSYAIHRATYPSRPTILINPAVKVAYNHRQYWLVNWPIPSPILGAWRIIWRDFMAYRLFVWITEGQRWPNECKLKQRYRAAPPEPTSSTAPTAVAATSLAIS